MVVGQDIPLFAHDESGAHASLPQIRGIVPEASEGAEEIPEGIPLPEGAPAEPFKAGVLDLFADLNVDHAGPHLLRQRAEIARHHG